MKTRLSRTPSHSAFSLVELLVVITIIGLISAFAVPAVGNLLKGSALTQAGNLLTDQCAAARQQALARNRSVEVRFYKFINPLEPGGTSQFRALQFFEIAEGGIPNPTGKFVRFSDTVIMNPTPKFSSLLDTTFVQNPTPNDPDLPNGVGRTYQYIGFRFQPDGTTSLLPTGPAANGNASGRWYITVHLLSDLGRTTGDTPPPNFFTWIIDPVSGSTRILRPGVK